MRTLFYLIIFFISFPVFSQYTQVKSASKLNTPNGVELNYFFEPVEGKDSLGIDLYYVELIAYRNDKEGTSNEPWAYEYTLPVQKLEKRLDPKNPSIRFDIYTHLLQLPEGNYYVRADLYTKRNKQSLSTQNFKINAEPCEYVQFYIHDFVIVPSDWDFAGDVFPLAKVFTKNSSKGKGHPDPFITIQGKDLRYVYKHFGDDILSVYNQEITFIAKTHDVLSFYLKDFDTFSKNDNIFLSGAFLKVEKSNSGKMSFKNENTQSLNIEYKVFERPDFGDLLLRKWSVSDSMGMANLEFEIPLNNSDFPLKKLMVALDVFKAGNKQSTYFVPVELDAVSRNVRFVVTCPILELAGDIVFKASVRDESFNYPLYQNGLSLTNIWDGFDLRWVHCKEKQLDATNRKIALQFEGNSLLKSEKIINQFTVWNAKDWVEIDGELNELKNGKMELPFHFKKGASSALPAQMQILAQSFIIRDGARLKVGEELLTLNIDEYVQVEGMDLTIHKSFEKSVRNVKLVAQAEDFEIEIIQLLKSKNSQMNIRFPERFIVHKNQTLRLKIDGGAVLDCSTTWGEIMTGKEYVFKNSNGKKIKYRVELKND